MRIIARIIVNKKHLSDLYNRFLELSLKYEMNLKDDCKVYWKDRDCYEIFITFSPCPVLTHAEWEKIYYFLFNQEYELENDEFGREKNWIVFAHCANLDELKRIEEKHYFVLFYVPTKMCTEYSIER